LGPLPEAKEEIPMAESIVTQIAALKGMTVGQLREVY
jgi:hypothetical protein